MNKKNIVYLSVLIAFFGLYIVLVFFTFGFNKSTNGYLVVSKLGGYYCNHSSCTYKTIEDMNLENKNILVYQNQEFLGSFNLSYTSSWNFYQNNSWKPVHGDFLGIEESLNAKPINYRLENLNESDYKYLSTVLKSHNFNGYKALNESTAIVLDLDSNGVDDRLLCLSNQTEESTDDKYFSTFLLILNGKGKEIYFEESDSHFSLPFYNVFSILKIDDGKKPFLIINKNYYDQIGEPSIQMLQFKKNTLKEVEK